MKNKNGLYVFFGILLVLVVGFLALNPFQQVIYSSTISSITDAYVLDDGQKIVVQAQISPSGNQNLRIDFELDEVNQFLNQEGYEATDISTLYMAMTDPSRDFFAGSQRVPVYEYGYYKISSFNSCENNKPVDEYIYLNSVIDLFSKYCIYKYPVGSLAPFSNVEEDNSDVQFRINNENIGVISPSSGNNIINSADGKVNIRWSGNLANFRQVTTPNSYALFNDKSQFSKMVYYSGISETQNIDQEAMEDFTGGGIKSISTLEEQIRDKNNRVNNLLIDRRDDYRNDVNAESIQLTDEGVRVYTDYANVFPTFTITLDAEYVQIEKLSGEPSIIDCIGDSTISSTSYYNGQLSVKNIGDNSGSFYGTVSCSGDSQISDRAIQIGLVEAGDSERVSVQLTGVNSESGTQRNNCQVEIIDAESGQSDTCNFDLNVKYVESIICQPNEKICADLNTLQICNSDGSDYELIDCDYGCVVTESGEAMCRISDDDDDDVEGECEPWIKAPEFMGGGVILPDLFCIIGNWFSSFFAPIRWVVAIVGSLGVGLFSFRFSRKNLFNKKKDKWINIIVGLVLGISAGILIYNYFWLGIITLIIFGIIKFVLPKF